ncbi:response regulator [Arenibacter sp. BSSL-BM3]|uniref:Response regulator n=1 Tax=Arenibacter arenosicollis TaxID=2762274 RepID=A0ABR7QRF0_9FLAO|nr:response regulator [Arenibacter arenosicollis]MBC8769775.1 response regulator [Arenibacter arenosicollis]
MTKINSFPSKIILVDDDEDDRDLFAEAFQSLNLQSDLVLFKNGQELLEYIQKLDNLITTHIFLDLNMPLISGMEILRQLRKTLKVNDSFVTIYSTSASPRDVENAYKYGANGYLKKPSSYQQLCELICKAIQASTVNYGKQLAKNEFILNKD